MSDYVSDNKPDNVILLTECSMSDNVAMANPETDFVRPCNLCPEAMRKKAFKAVQDMIDVKFDPIKGHFRPELPIKDVKVI